MAGLSRLKLPKSLPQATASSETMELSQSERSSVRQPL